MRIVTPGNRVAGWITEAAETAWLAVQVVAFVALAFVGLALAVLAPALPWIAVVFAAAWAVRWVIS